MSSSASPMLLAGFVRDALGRDERLERPYREALAQSRIREV